MPLIQNSSILTALIDRHFAAPHPVAIGVAVSGGSDSLALLHLVARWGQDHGISVHAATVDHGLRSEAADEARFVAEICAGLDVPHTTLTWQGWDERGNLQAEARSARYKLLADWGRAGGLNQILLGHTMDDVAETFLIRLTRKSGVDGLAAMRYVFDRNGQDFGRPLLDAKRQILRDYLTSLDQSWCEDASNDDPKYDRVRMRKALQILAPLGIDAAVLAATSAHMSNARDALDALATMTARQTCKVDHGDVVFDRGGLCQAPDETQHRLLSTALKWVSGAQYTPRSDAIASLRTAIEHTRDMTLSGCLVSVSQTHVRILREYNAVRELTSSEPLWDRWQLSGPWRPGFEMRALSADGLRQIDNWRASGISRLSLVASPSVWRKETLISAPLAGFGPGWSAKIRPDRGDFPHLGG